ncbi:hypothetical protein R1sor_018368 [Riccia sorocarpa]|uniref:Uncharacterized protein n=1 Tax=Riccia sorocarpa TaxID=122646 RepID=A0ABD3IDK4_9MARC
MHCMDDMAANSFEKKRSGGRSDSLGGGSMRLMPDFLAPHVPSARRPPQEAPQDVGEDAGPFLQDPPCTSGNALSGDVGTETTYLFKEVFREPKPPRKYKARDGRYHLPNNFTKKEVYDHYTMDMLQVHQCLRYSSFKRYWLKYYPLVTIPTTNTFSVCDFCELYKSKRTKVIIRIEKVEALQLHRKQHVEVRVATGRRRWKALDTPKDCAYIHIDGMDQNKTALPHFAKQLKSLDGAALVGVHLVGAMIFHGKLMTHLTSLSLYCTRSF